MPREGFVRINGDRSNEWVISPILYMVSILGLYWGYNHLEDGPPGLVSEGK